MYGTQHHSAYSILPIYKMDIHNEMHIDFKTGTINQISNLSYCTSTELDPFIYALFVWWGNSVRPESLV